jgi:hypothetical protein
MSDLLPLCYLDVSDPALLRASFMRLPSILCGDSALGALFSGRAAFCFALDTSISCLSRACFWATLPDEFPSLPSVLHFLAIPFGTTSECVGGD